MGWAEEGRLAIERCDALLALGADDAPLLCGCRAEVLKCLVEKDKEKAYLTS